MDKDYVKYVRSKVDKYNFYLFTVHIDKVKIPFYQQMHLLLNT